MLECYVVQRIACLAVCVAILDSPEEPIPAGDLGCLNVDITTLHACSMPSISAREQVDFLNGHLCLACLESFANILLMTANR